jgi:hydroxypyruvate isomerase
MRAKSEFRPSSHAASTRQEVRWVNEGRNLAHAPERGCAESQPQQVRRSSQLGFFDVMGDLMLLRLVFTTALQNGACARLRPVLDPPSPRLFRPGIPGKLRRMKSSISRRTALRAIGGAAIAAKAVSTDHLMAADANAPASTKLKGHIRHSVCRWCYAKIPLEDLCQAARDMGIESIDLMEVKDFPVLKKYGLTCAMVTGVPGMITNGLNRPENHDAIVQFFEQTLPAAAEFGAPNAICFSGNRKGMSDDEGLEHCAAGLRHITPLAEKHGVTLCMELLNSRRNHKDYMCDHTAWGVELCRRVGSERFKLLYDIFHMQIMEGDLIETIRANDAYIAHYHTGGVPGRGEIDDTQEIQYPAVMRAIVATGYRGFVAQEFIPTRPDPLESLRQGIAICDV